MAKYWIGNRLQNRFNTVPRILPLVFALHLVVSLKNVMFVCFNISKTMHPVRNIVLQPDYILTDFEQADFGAVRKQKFTNNHSQLNLFHLGRSMAILMLVLCILTY